MKRLSLFIISLVAFFFIGIQQINSEVISAGQNEPEAKEGYAILRVFGENGHAGLTRISDGENVYSLYLYSGYTGAISYYYITPGTYTVTYLNHSGTTATCNGTILQEGISFTIYEGQTTAALIYK